MASNFSMNVSQDFNIGEFTEAISQQYQAQGFNVRVLKMNNSTKIVFDKGCGGMNTLLGLGQGISATCSLMGKDKDMLSVSFSDADWTGKIVGLAVGWIICFIPFITALIGLFRQLSLPKNIASDMQMILSNYN